MINSTNILLFLKTLKQSDFYIEHIFTRGSCYQLYKILKVLYRDAIPYINKIDEDHIVTKIGNNLYDINGIVKDENNYKLLDEELFKEVSEWSFSKNNFMGIKICPYCDEIIYYEKNK